jgi:hypothetical protein
MMHATELREAIAEAQKQKENCAHRAFRLEDRCRGIRADNPNDPRIPEMSIQIDALDELHDQLSDDIGRMSNMLWVIEAAHARVCVCRGLNGSEY